MLELLNKIHNFFKEKYNIKEEDIEKMDHDPENLSVEIAAYAHKDQRRINGELYVNHPLNVLEIYERLVYLNTNDPTTVDIDLLKKYSIPFEGVSEVCILHDVLEDTSISMNDIENIFKEVGLQKYFNECIKIPLKLISKNSSKDYEKYICNVLKHPTSALVKMCDIYDNLNPLTLDSFDNYTLDRSKRYLLEMYLINLNYCFVENCNKYKKELLSRLENMKEKKPDASNLDTWILT